MFKLNDFYTHLVNEVTGQINSRSAQIGAAMRQRKAIRTNHVGHYWNNVYPNPQLSVNAKVAAKTRKINQLKFEIVALKALKQDIMYG